MMINSSENHSPEGQAKIHLDQLFNNSSVNSSSVNVQAVLAYAQFQMISNLIKVYELLGSTRSLSNLAAIKAGFASADETAMAGSIVGAGGLVLGTTGVVQGVGKLQEAKGIAEAAKARNDDLKVLDKEPKVRDLNKGITVEVESVDEPCISSVNEDIVIEVEENALCGAEEAFSVKQSKIEDRAEAVKQTAEENNVFSDTEQNKRIKLVNKEYEIFADSHKTKSGKFQSVGTPGQAAYYVAQGLAEHQKAKSQKESLIQQVQQDNQNQQGNTADGVKKEIDKLSDFDPFKRNSASLR